MTIPIHLSWGMASVLPGIDTDCDLEQLKPSSTVTDSEGDSGVSVCLCGGGVSLGDRETKSLWGAMHPGVWQEVAGVRECYTR